MADHLANQRVFLSLLDVRQPDFANQCTLWAAQAHREMRELVTAAKKEIASSHDLLSEVDRMLARR